MHKLTIYPSGYFKRERPLLNAVILSGITVALYAVGRLGHHDVALFWPMNAVLTGLFIRHQTLQRPGDYGVFIFATLIVAVIMGHRHLTGILIDISDIAFVTILCGLLRREKKTAEAYLKITIFRLYSYCLLTGLICSLLGAYFYALAHQSHFWQIYPAWLSEEFTTNVLVLPLVLLCCVPRSLPPPQLSRIVQVLLLASIWCAIVYSLPATCLLTLLAGVIEVLLVDHEVSGSGLMGQISPIISARLGLPRF